MGCYQKKKKKKKKKETNSAKRKYKPCIHSRYVNVNFFPAVLDPPNKIDWRWSFSRKSQI